MDEDIWMYEMMVKLAGPMFTHAQMNKQGLSDNYEKFFSKIFKNI